VIRSQAMLLKHRSQRHIGDENVPLCKPCKQSAGRYTPAVRLPTDRPVTAAYDIQLAGSDRKAIDNC